MGDSSKQDVRLPSFGQLLKSPAELLAYGFGSGLAPVAPGTFGTLAAVPFFLGFYFLYIDGSLPLVAYQVGLILSLAAGIYFCDKATARLGVHDHGAIVWDEFVGFWIAMLPVLSFGVGDWGIWVWTAIGFGLFRFFDILKPFPIGLLDKRLKGGVGIMVDDVMAGIHSAIVIIAIQMYQQGRFEYLFQTPGATQ